MNFYDMIAPAYPLAERFFSGGIRMISGILNLAPEGSLLEIGTGCGSLLQQVNRHQLTGIDNSQQMLRRADRRLAGRGIQLILMNGEQLRFPDQSFDYVVINHVLSVTPDPEQMLREAHRVLKKGGLLFVHNHFTPPSLLGLADWLLQPAARLLRFRSWFPEKKLITLSKFPLCRRIHTAPVGYFQLLILSS